jgi:hypothetical protein
LLDKAIEELSPGPAGAPVEPEGELVQVEVELVGLDGPLVRS